VVKKGKALLLTFRAEPGITSALYPPFHIPGRLPMPRNIDFDHIYLEPPSPQPSPIKGEGEQLIRFWTSHVKMKLPGLKSRVSFGLPGFAGLPTLRSGRHSSPGLKAWGFLAGFINII